jgi:hypothetical protein
MHKNHYIAFFDESGNSKPFKNKSGYYSPFFSYGMIVMPLDAVSKINSEWQRLNKRYTGINDLIEPKASSLRSYAKLLEKGIKPKGDLKPLYDSGIDINTVNKWIKDIISFINGLKEYGAYSIASVVNKEQLWAKETPYEYYQYKNTRFKNWGRRNFLNEILKKLQLKIYSTCYSELLLRLEYSLTPSEKNGVCILIGDENIYHTELFYFYKQLRNKVNNKDLQCILNCPAFSSSKYTPGLQIADWIAYEAVKWAEGENSYISHFKEIYREYEGKIIGCGLVLLPDTKLFPTL